LADGWHYRSRLGFVNNLFHKENCMFLRSDPPNAPITGPQGSGASTCWAD
jgi:hypothetical protein